MRSYTGLYTLIACPIANHLLAKGWYGIFKMRWMFAHGLTEAEIDTAARPWLPPLAGAVCAAVAALLFLWLFRRMGVRGWLDGLRTGAAIGLLTLMGISVMILFSRHSFEIALIDGGYNFLTISLYGLITGALRKIRNGGAAA